MTPTTPQTIPQLFEESVRKYPNNAMMLEKRNGAYRPATYTEVRAQVRRCAAGLIFLGVKQGDRLALIAEGRNDWVIAELGMMYAGAINVPLSVKIDELGELRFRIAHSGCRIVVVSGSQAPKIRKIRTELPALEKIIVLDADAATADEMTFEDLLNKGDTLLATKPEDFETRWKSVSGSDAANICYTSGTTADPKGIILTHRNYTANVEQASGILEVPQWYSSLLILPWDHCFAHTAGIYTLMRNGASMASVQLGKTPIETLKNIPVNIKETKPTFLLSVPSLAKNFRKNIEKGIAEKGPVVSRLFQTALKNAYAYIGNGWNKGKGLRALRKPLHTLFDAILFKKIRANFGGRLQFFIGGGALLDIELQRFFYAIGIPMYQGYGLTEATPVISANVPMAHKLGSSGRIVPNLEIKICDEVGNPLPAGQKGEIVVRGENVMAGYWNNEKATIETIKDGWLHTSDLGYMDEDGFLYVLGREKSLLIAHDGEKYSPEGIEEAIVAHSAFIDQIMLYNNQSPYTVALVVPNKQAVAAHLAKHQLSPANENAQRDAIQLIADDIAAFREKGKYAGMFPARWIPSAFALLEEGFTEQNRLMNSTLKIVRGKIEERYADRLRLLFAAEGKDPLNAANRTIVANIPQ